MNDPTHDDNVDVSIKRLDWGIIFSLLLSSASLLFTGGVVYGQVQMQGREIEQLKSARESDRRDFDDLKTIVVRIDANVTSLADRAREDRAFMERKR